MAGLAPATLAKHHHILHGALEAAVRAQFVARNVAKLVTGKPHAPDGHADAIAHCWTADEASSFLATAKAAGAWPAAFYGLALDSGMRKSELCGLLWRDVDLTGGRIRVSQQLLTGGLAPTFTPVKGKVARTVDIAPETVELLRTHKARQAALNFRNRQHYHDHGLVFTKDWSEARHGDTLGDPLQANNLGQREYARDRESGTFARSSSTACATPVRRCSWRLACRRKSCRSGSGTRKIGTTLDIYAHVLPSMQRDAARQLAALLHRR